MKPENQIRHLAHLLVDRMIDNLLYSPVQVPPTLHSTIQGREVLAEEKNFIQDQPIIRQEVTPNDVQCERAKRALKRMGWRMS